MGEARRRKARGEYPGGPCEITVRQLPPGELPRDARRVFLLEDCEPITPELVRVLVGEGGWTERDLREAAQLGGVYCRPRGSLIFAEGVEYAIEGGERVIHCHALVPWDRPHAA